jgi:hypothetical protein
MSPALKIVPPWSCDGNNVRPFQQLAGHAAHIVKKKTASATRRGNVHSDVPCCFLRLLVNTPRPRFLLRWPNEPPRSTGFSSVTTPVAVEPVFME